MTALLLLRGDGEDRARVHQWLSEQAVSLLRGTGGTVLALIRSGKDPVLRQ
jgi:hypothetical protein